MQSMTRFSSLEWLCLVLAALRIIHLRLARLVFPVSDPNSLVLDVHLASVDVFGQLVIPRMPIKGF